MIFSNAGVICVIREYLEETGILGKGDGKTLPNWGEWILLQQSMFDHFQDSATRSAMREVVLTCWEKDPRRENPTILVLLQLCNSNLGLERGNPAHTFALDMGFAKKM